MNTKLTKIFLSFLSFLLLLMLADLIYVYKNEPKKLGDIFLYLAVNNSKKRSPDKTLENLDNAARFYLKENRILYKSFYDEAKIENNLTKINNKTKEKLLEYLKNNLPVALNKKSIPQVAIIYYNLGLMVYRDDYHKEATEYFQTAIFLEPESGQLYLELADAYFYSGDFEKGNEVLKKCLQFDSPKKQCQDYLGKNVRIK